LKSKPLDELLGSADTIGLGCLLVHNLLLLLLLLLIFRCFFFFVVQVDAT